MAREPEPAQVVYKKVWALNTPGLVPELVPGLMTNRDSYSDNSWNAPQHPSSVSPDSGVTL